MCGSKKCRAVSLLAEAGHQNTFSKSWSRVKATGLKIFLGLMKPLGWAAKRFKEEDFTHQDNATWINDSRPNDRDSYIGNYLIQASIQPQVRTFLMKCVIRFFWTGFYLFTFNWTFCFTKGFFFLKSCNLCALSCFVVCNCINSHLFM